MISILGIIVSVLLLSSKFGYQSRELPTLFQRASAILIKTFSEISPLWFIRVLFDSVGWFEQAMNGFLIGKKRRKWCRKIENVGNWAGYLIAEDAQNSKVGYDADVVILYAHGGGFVSGNALLSLVVFVRWIKSWKSSHNARVHILSLEYGLSPENSFPVARDNMIDCYLWLVNVKKISPSKIVFAGDSAGANLATISALYILHNPVTFSVPVPSALLLISPCFSALSTSPSFRFNKQYDILSVEYFHRCVKQYLGDSNQLPDNPLISPLFHDKLNGLPKIWTCVGSYEILLDDVISFTEKARSQNVKVELVVAPHNAHNYAVVWPISRGNAAGLAMKSMAKFLFG